MRTLRELLLTVLVGLLGTAVYADETAEKIAAQKKAAQANWEKVEAGDMAHLETKWLLIYAPASMEKNLKTVGPLLEKHIELAAKALGYDLKELPWSGKLTVYLFAEQAHFAAFARRVEKRRVRAETSSWGSQEAGMHVAVSPAKGRTNVPLSLQAGEQLANLLLGLKAGTKTPLPGWLATGFGRATCWRVSPTIKSTVSERRQAATLARSHSSSDLWYAKVEGEEADVMAASVADFMAYGPGASRFPKFVEGFKLEDNMQERTTDQALTAANLSAAKINQLWKTWAQKR
jgi:hypothetical protein